MQASDDGEEMGKRRDKKRLEVCLSEESKKKMGYIQPAKIPVCSLNGNR